VFLLSSTTTPVVARDLPFDSRNECDFVLREMWSTHSPRTCCDVDCEIEIDNGHMPRGWRDEFIGLLERHGKTSPVGHLSQSLRRCPLEMTIRPLKTDCTTDVSGTLSVGK
jgi:hypothetical protein